MMLPAIGRAQSTIPVSRSVGQSVSQSAGKHGYEGESPMSSNAKNVEISTVALQETVDYVAVTRLQGAYADVVNRRAWTELDELFRPDAHVTVDTVTNDPFELDGPVAVGAFIGGAIERFSFFEFVILNTRVSLGVDGDASRATARVFMCELRQDGDNGHASQAFGVYHDHYVKIEGRWWFAKRNYQSLTRTGRNEVFDFPPEFGWNL